MRAADYRCVLKFRFWNFSAQCAIETNASPFGMTFFNWQNQQVMQASQLSLLIVGLLELQKNVYGGPLKDCYLDSLWWKFWSSNTPSQLAMINRHPKSSRGSFLADLWVFAQRVEIAAATIVMFSSLVWSLETAKMMNDVAKYTVKNSISLSSFLHHHTLQLWWNEERDKDTLISR